MRTRALFMVLVAGCGFDGTGTIDDARRDGPGAGDGPAIDAPAPDATVDGPPPTCSTAGLSCPGQPAVVLACGDPADCWVGCTNGDQVDVASAIALCADWGGRLTPIYNQTELTCVRSGLSGGALLLGLSQANPPLGTPAIGWSWNGDMIAPTYLPWDGGQPDDADGTESGAEQCAFSKGTGDNAWHDAPCTAGFSRFSCRRP